MTMMPNNKELNKLLDNILPRNFSKYTAILWVKGVKESTEVKHVVDVLSSLNGVNAVEIAKQRPVMLKVDCCLQRTSVAQIVRNAAQHDITIKQIGC